MSEDWRIEYDRRQYRLMVDRLDAFRRKEIGAHTLISNLKGLLQVLELPDNDWVNLVMSEWGRLEVSYAMECERREQAGVDFASVDESVFNLETVKNAISALERLIHEKLDTLE